MTRHSFTKNTLALATVSLTLLISAACRKTETKPAPETGNINVGVIADLSGPTAAGLSTKNAVELARDEINQAGGINGRKLEVVVADDKGAPDQAVSAANSLTSPNKVHALIGEPSSGPALAAASKAQAAQVPMISLAPDAKPTQ